MNPFFEKVIPLLLAFGLGLGAKRLHLLKKEDAQVLLRFVLTLPLPALTILSISRAHLDLSMAFIPLSAMLVVFLCYVTSQLAGKLLALPKTTFGSFLVGTMIMNTAFSLPFFWAAYENEGLARASLFDMGNTFLIFTFTYYNAIKYGANSKSDRIDWNRFLRLPPLWAMAIAFLLKALRISIPAVGTELLNMVGQPTTPLILIALGLYFEPKLKNLVPASIAIFIRMGMGLCFGFLLAKLFGLEGISRIVVIASSSTPVGFNTLIFAHLENMDGEFAAILVSVSILIALFYLPLLIFLLG
ncbi:MAG: AEC family transporter [Candidatus Cloacimonetes bacterium]|nr:AEC family transporter [Candidatus Cloacimonadota bacterium]